MPRESRWNPYGTQRALFLALAVAHAHVQALPDMLEVLPPGASKGHGVEVLLKHLGIDPLDMMAIGECNTIIWRQELDSEQSSRTGRPIT